MRSNRCGGAVWGVRWARSAWPLLAVAVVVVAGARAGGAAAQFQPARNAALHLVAGELFEGRGPGTVFRDCESCPEMVVMPGGRVALGRYEVTVGEYQAFASAAGGGVADGCYGLGVELYDGGGRSIVWRRDASASWRDPGFPQTNRHPVVCVSWQDAQGYVSWLSRTTGAQYRLPTGAEWGRAVGRAAGGCAVNGADASVLAELGRRFGGDWTSNPTPCPRPDGAAYTAPVGLYGANGNGFSDMVGNVWEWTEDCWEGDCGRRVVRGGAWDVEAEYLRPSARDWLGTEGRSTTCGFRVARTQG
jgi:sulfatase modifying factor 1